MKHLPLLGPILRAVCVRAVRRLVEDLEAVILKLQAGIPLEQILTPSKKGGSSSIKAVKRQVNSLELVISLTTQIGI